ncbi:hypothetical protein ACFPIF_03050 [Brevundimonas faecalis]|uniref:hypothetical protein n=1 Tax=Brevundimonas faecalis TaxID=947378 RepID=UPI0036082D3D
MALYPRFLAVLAAVALTSTLAPPAFAQRSQNPNEPQATEGSGSRANRGRSERAPRGPSPERVRADVQGHLTALGNTCQISEAKLLGQSADANKTSMYEIACATGPGYIVLGSTPPSATDCLVLAASAQQARARDPEADVGTQCTLPANDNAQAVFASYAKEAGMDCAIDGAAIVGAASDGAIVYEIGCAGTEGARIQKSATGWTRSSCFELASINTACRFTTPAELAATLKGWLAGSEAANCDVQQSRFMGQNANGVFYEASCAGADGVIVRFNAEKAVQQVYPCATAQPIGGGCKLTTTPPAATPQA